MSGGWSRRRIVGTISLATAIKGNYNYQAAAGDCPADRTQVKVLVAVVKDNRQAATVSSLMDKEVVKTNRASHQATRCSLMDKAVVKTNRASHQVTGGSLMDKAVVKANRASHQATGGSLMDKVVAKANRTSHQAATGTARRQINLVGKGLVETIKVSRARKSRVEMLKINH